MLFVPFSNIFGFFVSLFVFLLVFCPPVTLFTRLARPRSESITGIFSSFFKKSGTLEWACSPELCQVGLTP